MADTADRTGTRTAARRRRAPAGVRRRPPVLVSVAVFAGLALLWWLITAAGAVDKLFLPGPGAVLSQLGELARGGELWEDLGVSIYRIAGGFLIATVIALPLGVLMGRYRMWAAALEPLVDFVRYMPVVAFVPLTILWVGTGDSQKFLIIFLGTFFQQVLLFADNVRRVPGDLVDVGRTLGMTPGRVLRRIVFRAAAPGLWDSLRISLGWAWTWLVVAELVAATSGLGYRITTAQRYLSTETIIGYILVLGLLGLITDQALRFGGRILFRPAETGAKR